MSRGESEGRAADDDNSLNGARLERLLGGGGGGGIGHGAGAWSPCSKDWGATRTRSDTNRTEGRTAGGGIIVGGRGILPLPTAARRPRPSRPPAPPHSPDGPAEAASSLPVGRPPSHLVPAPGVGQWIARSNSPGWMERLGPEPEPEPETRDLGFHI